MNIDNHLEYLNDMTEKDAKNEIKKLYEEAEYNAKLYYEEDSSEISDYEYDIIIRKIKYLEEKYPKIKSKNSITTRIGGIPNSSFEKVVHRVPLQSLQDVFTYGEIYDFDQRVRKELNKEEIEYIVETKIDGLSAALSYKDGRYFLGATRGNGEIRRRYNK